MIVRLVKGLLLAVWSVVLAYMVVSLANGATLYQHFGLAVMLASALFFLLLWSAFDIAPTKGNEMPSRFPHDEEPLLGCPTCHGEMHLLGANVRQGRTALYLWTCERDHGWSRQGDSPADETYPWQACNPAEMMGVFFG